MGIFVLKISIRRSSDHLIFSMGIPIQVRWLLSIEMAIRLPGSSGGHISCEQDPQKVWFIICGFTLAPGGCFTNVSRARQDILSKCVYCRNRTSYENFKLKLCTCAQSHALGTRAKFQLGILTINVVSGTVYFRDIILESTRNASETTPWLLSFHLLSMIE